MSDIATKLTTIAENQQKVYDAGHEKGNTDGYNAGYSTGKADGVTDGKKAEHEEFWNGYLNRSSLAYAFCGFDGNIFYPTKDIRSVNFNSCFSDFNTRSAAIDLEGRLKHCGCSLDTSQATNVGNMFYGANVKRVGVIDLTKSNAIVQLFYNCKALVTIDELIMPSNQSAIITNVFNGCSKLQNIKISGTIGTSISFSPCYALTHDSLMSIINALSQATASRKLTLGSINIAKLTAEELTLIEQKGWTYA